VPDKIRGAGDERQTDHPGIAHGELLGSGRDAAEPLKPADHALDDVAGAVETAVEDRLPSTPVRPLPGLIAALGWDHRLHTAHRCKDRSRFVRHHRGRSGKQRSDAVIVIPRNWEARPMKLALSSATMKAVVEEFEKRFLHDPGGAMDQ
jgi:hypothetical protein